ncbi:MAG TPA: beta-galactosidase trimerization domain-containing protein [Chloroflexota bacterium]|nr:beta-galactosidase trimerization domain-containing protein [Chloroflexota bacterium]
MANPTIRTAGDSRLPFRQVHLDFHTSPLIEGIGERFDPEQFTRALRDAHVDSVTCFATCHHGLSYYPTKVGTRHPHLTRDLLGEQVEACHRHGIRAPGYITVVWAEEQANQHPEWRQVRKDGMPAGRKPLGPIALHDWQWLCMNSPYADHVAAVTEEVARGYPVDGLFFDIVMTVPPGCVCRSCLRSMAAEGLNPEDDGDLRRHALSVERRFMDRISSLARGLRPDLTLFFNSRLRLTGDPHEGMRPEIPYFTHWEIESLASGGWGYGHFPLYNRYFQTLPKPRLGMTAAFHRSWADFGTIKSQAALDYECFRMLAGGAVCSIGDQLHPNGVLNPETYRRIGVTYASVAAKEPWCRGAVPLTDLGLLPRPTVDSGTRSSGLESEHGATRMLLELGLQFAVLDREADFMGYKVIIAPDGVRLDGSLAAKLRQYLADGGALLLSHESGLATDGAGFALDEELGVDYLGPSRDDVEFFRPEGDLASTIPLMDHALYDRGSAVRARSGTEILGRIVSPYFSRTWAHFSSHAQTPPNPDNLPGLAAAAIRGRVAYLAHPLFRSYHAHGYPVYRQIVGALLHRLLPEPLVRTNLPTTGEVTLLRQKASGSDEERLVCHILHYVPQRRTPDLDLVEDVVPLHDIELGIRTVWTPSAAYLAPERTPLLVTMKGDYACMTIPRVVGHAMVVLEP